MLHKACPHLKRHNKKYLASMLILTLAVVMVQYGILNAPTAKAEASEKWPSPVLLSDEFNTYDKFYANVIPLSDGNHIAIWTQYSATFTNIIAQKFDSDGNLLWANPVIISDNTNDAWGREYYKVPAAPDSSGGFYFGYYESYNNAVVKRISGTGVELYSNQLEITNGNDENGEIDMIPDGDGGVYVVWMDATTSSLYLNRFNNTLVAHANWNPADPKNADGALLITSGDIHSWLWEKFNPKIKATDSGSVIVTAMKNFPADNVDGIIAKKINSTGTFDTTFGTVEIKDPTVTVRDIWPPYDFTPTTDNGLVTIFSNNTDGSGNGYEVHAIKYDNQGNPSWVNTLSPGYNYTSGYVAPKVISDGSGDLIVIYENRTGTVNGTDWTFINAQKLAGTDGSGLWNSGSPIIVAEAADRHIKMTSSFNETAPDGNGGVYVTFLAERFSGNNVGIQQINNDGTLGFTDTYYYESNHTDVASSIALDPSGDAIVVYDVTKDYIYAQRVGDNTPSGGCGLMGDGQVCGSMELQCPTITTNFVTFPNDFQLGSSGHRTIRSVNDTSYVPENSSAYFNETNPGLFVDTTDSLSISSNIPFSCGDTGRSVNLTVEATPFVNGSAQPMITYGADGVVDSPAYSNDDYTAMFSVITSGAASCTGTCVLANGSVEAHNEQKYGENNYFKNPGPSNKIKNDLGFDLNAILLDTNNSTNTVTLYSASHGLQGEVTIPGLDFNLILPANLANGGTYTSQVTYTLF